MVQAAGLHLDDRILIVHSGLNEISFSAAAWVYWVMKSSGFQKIAILDGGVRAWKQAGGEVTRTAYNVAPSDTQITFSDAWIASTSEVAEISDGSHAGTLLDARAGEVEEGSSIQGAMSYAMTMLMGEDTSKALAPIDILERLKAVDANWEQESVIAFCNNGLQGAATWFMASEVVGIENVRLYSESLQGWNATNSQ